MNSKNKQLKKILGFFLAVDRFGTELQLTINKKKAHNTIFGSITTLLIYAFLIYTIVQQIMDMTDGKKVNILFTQEFTKDPEVRSQLEKFYQAIEMKPDNFAIALVVTDNYSQPIFQFENSTVYIPQIASCVRISSELGMKTECFTYNLKPCEELNYQQETLDRMNVEPTIRKFGYCIDKEAWETKFPLQGFSQSQVFKFISINILRCFNNTIDNKTCAPEEYIQQTLKGGYYAFIITDQLLNQQQQGNPYNIYGKTMFAEYSIKQYNYMHLFYRHSFIYTIKNFFYYFGGSELVHHELIYDHQESYSDLLNQRDTLVRIIVQLDDKKDLYYRTYDNILTILANIGGLEKTLLTICTIIIMPISNILLHLTLANKIFQFAGQKQQNQSRVLPVDVLVRKNTKLQRKMTLMKKVLVSQNMKEIIDKEKSSDVQQLKQFVKRKMGGIHLNFLQVICFFFSKHKKQMIAGIEMVENHLDVSYILRKLMEIDRLKKVLLTSDQQKLFEYLPKPEIQEQISQNNKQFYENLVEAFKAYNNLCENIDQNPLNINIINMIELEVKNLFNEMRNGNQIFFIILQEVQPNSNILLSNIDSQRNVLQKSNLQDNLNERLELSQ